MADGDGKAGNGLAAKDLGEIAAAVSALIAVLAGVAVTGVLERTQRDHGVWLLAAFACVLAAAVVWLLAILWQGGVERLFQSLGALGFAVGIALAVVAVLKTQQEAERPAVSASFDPEQSAIAGSVRAEGLTPSQRILIRVDGLVYPEAGNPTGEVRDVRNLYFGVAGPDPDGNVNEPIHVLVPPGRFDAIGVKGWTGGSEQCSYPEEVKAAATGPLPQSKRAGCLIFRIPVSAERPQLTAEWEKGRSPILILHSTARSAHRFIGIRAVGVGQRGVRPLVTWFGDPSADGSLSTTMRIPIPSGVSTVCAEARFVPADGRIFRLQCPIAARRYPFARMQLAVP